MNASSPNNEEGAGKGNGNEAKNFHGNYWTILVLTAVRIEIAV